MKSYKKTLIVVYRKESAQDFEEIARRIRKLDPTIAVYMVAHLLTSKMVPSYLFDLPLLVIYLVNPPVTNFSVAKKLAVEEISKIEEYDHFKKHNIPCLPIERFAWGMELDPLVYGDWVVLKPEHIQSTGRDVNMIPTKEISKLKLADFPDGHLIHQDSYLVQKFVKTGEYPTHYRATVFLNEVICSMEVVQNSTYPAQSNPINELLKNSVASNLTDNRAIKLMIDNEINAFALRIAEKFPMNPLLGIDVIRDQETGDLFVLETNSGGNTWHFSSEIGRKAREYMGGRKPMVLQYNAWDRAAEALVRKTHELAK